MITRNRSLWEGSMRGLVILIVALGLLAGAYLADGLVNQLVRDGARNFDSAPATLAWVLVRVAAVAGILALGWLALRGPRSRLIGGAMLVVGAYVTLALPMFMLGLLPLALLPFFAEQVGRSDVILWTGSAVAVIGALCLARPSPAARKDQPVAARAAQPTA
jgi:hypothetical protein